MRLTQDEAPPGGVSEVGATNNLGLQALADAVAPPLVVSDDFPELDALPLLSLCREVEQ
jgi:hypothetical protein